MTGNTNQATPERTLQSFRIPEGMYEETHVCESTYKVRSYIQGGFDASGIDFVPWESMRHCHDDGQYITKFCGAAAWKPVSCDVEIFNMRAHADIPINTAAFYPINLDQVRVRYIDQSAPLAWRRSVFETIGQYNTWRTLIANQDDGLVDKDLPTTTVYIGNHRNLGRSLDYDEVYWTSKKVHDDEMIDFHWSGDGPWRHCNEMYLPYLLKLPTGISDTAAKTNAEWLVESRFDYASGIIEAPMGDRRVFRLFNGQGQQVNNDFYKPIRLCLKHSSITKALLTEHSALTKGITDLTATAMDLRTRAEALKYLGDETQMFAGNRTISWIDDLKSANDIDQSYVQEEDIPHYDNNVQKPIYLTFSRFMKNDNAQEYRVYYELRIKHTFKVLKYKRYPNKNLRNSSSARWPNNQGIGIADKMLPFSIWSSPTNENTSSGLAYIQNDRTMRFYRPHIYPVFRRSFA